MVAIIGHSGCGAVSGAVDSYLHPVKFWSKSASPTLRSITQRISYLHPVKFWSKSASPTLRSITQRIFVAVREVGPESAGLAEVDDIPNASVSDAGGGV